MVAPHVGAWIETAGITPVRSATIGVAPHVGAWIETTGLRSWLSIIGVAPHVGAWIETNYGDQLLIDGKSHLT